MAWDNFDYPRKRNSPALLVLAVVLGIGLGALALHFFNNGWPWQPAAPLNDPNAQPRVPEPKTEFDYEETQSINVFDGARESVVNVDTIQSVSNFDLQVLKRQTGTGSGFVWDDEGRIVTNYHVIAGALRPGSATELRPGASVRVVFSDSSASEAKVVGTAENYDLAVLKVQTKDKLKPIRVGTSKDLKVGQKLFAIGNPFGLSLTMTKGIISALGREINSPGGKTITGAIQLDAPINPGNSGGPLLDKDGRLIGVNTSIATPSGGNVGIGFAIPVDTVNEVVPKLIADRSLPRPDLGVTLVEPEILRQNRIFRGAMIAAVEPGSPAQIAGLRGLTLRGGGTADPGDLILKIDDVTIANNSDFLKTIARKKVGDTINLTIERDKKTRDVEATLRGL